MSGSHVAIRPLPGQGAQVAAQIWPTGALGATPVRIRRLGGFGRGVDDACRSSFNLPG